MIHSFYEFFAGGGMVRAGLGKQWQCLFANDYDPQKAQSYQENWGSQEFLCADVNHITLKDLPHQPDLVWASFPCQDLSLAGAGAGLKGQRSGTFWPFWKLVKGLNAEGRPPKIIALENVCGAITSNNGEDFISICSALEAEGFYFGAIIIDAVKFVPQSRPRLFIIAIQKDMRIPRFVISEKPSMHWPSQILLDAHKKLSEDCKARWIWWDLPEPPVRKATFADILENEPQDVKWHSLEQTQNLLSMMSPTNLEKVKAAQRMGRPITGTIYKRTRRENGIKVQRAEVRFDEIAGCLRTPAGGSSRQLVMIIKGDLIRSRLISGRETARLMGLDENYVLPTVYNQAYHLTGDGVAVPVVSYLAKHLFEPALQIGHTDREAA